MNNDMFDGYTLPWESLNNTKINNIIIKILNNNII